MKITSGEFEVLAAGSVISYKLEPLMFHIAPNFKVAFIFIEDTNFENATMGFHQISDDTIAVNLLNFNSSLDTGNLEPLFMGTLDGKLVYLNFRVRATDSKMSRTVDYTWYLKQIAPDAPAVVGVYQEGGQNG